MITWEQFFGKTSIAGPFKIFSINHLCAIAVIISFILIFSFILSKEKFASFRKPFRYSIAFLLIAQELSFEAWQLHTGNFHPGLHLPFHLCGMSVLLSAFIMVTKKYAVFEVLYFWGLAGATQAILTPDIGIFGFPHFRFFQIFVSHGLIISTVCYMCLVEGYRPYPKSIFKAFLFTNLYMIFAAFLNIATDGNYMYLCRKPPTKSLMDYLGPWPWYIVNLEFIGIFAFSFVYLPYCIKDFFMKMRAKNSNGWFYSSNS